MIKKCLYFIFLSMITVFVGAKESKTNQEKWEEPYRSFFSNNLKNPIGDYQEFYRKLFSGSKSGATDKIDIVSKEEISKIDKKVENNYVETDFKSESDNSINNDKSYNQKLYEKCSSIFIIKRLSKIINWLENNSNFTKTAVKKDDQFYMFDGNGELSSKINGYLVQKLANFYKKSNQILVNNLNSECYKKDDQFYMFDVHHKLNERLNNWMLGVFKKNCNKKNNIENNILIKKLRNIINWINDDSDWRRVDKEWNDYNKYNKEDCLIKNLDSQKNRCSGEVRQKLKNNSPHTTNEDCLDFGQSLVGIDNEPKIIEDSSNNNQNIEQESVVSNTFKNPCILNVSDTSGSKDKKVANNIIANGIDNGLTVIGAAATIYALYYIYKNYIKEKINNYRKSTCN